jgi:glucose-1-phosphate thymidylyltransferase
MDVIIFAGGAGTRMRPLVAAPIPKHLIPVGDYPLIYHVLQTAVRGGASRLLLSLNGPHPELTIETVTAFNLPIPVAYTHTNNAFSNGPAHDLYRLKPWVRANKPVGIMLADAYFNVPIDFIGKPAPHVWTMTLPPEVDASQFGQVIGPEKQVQALYEKPAKEQSRVILTGATKLPFDVFARTQALCHSHSQELHLGDVIKTYVADGSLRHTLLPTGAFIDCGNRTAWNQAQLDRTSRL